MCLCVRCTVGVDGQGIKQRAAGTGGDSMREGEPACLGPGCVSLPEKPGSIENSVTNIREAEY